MTEWWCTRCGGPADMLEATLDARHPWGKCRDCKHRGDLVDTAAAAASCAQLVHDRQHGGPNGCPGWCTRDDGRATPMPTSALELEP